MRETPGNGNKYFLTLSLAYVIVTVTILTIWGIPYKILHYLNWGFGVVALCITSAVVGRAIYCLYHYRPRHPFTFLWSDFKQMARDRGVLALPIILMYPFLIGTYMTIKGAFPLLNDYGWDPFFMDLDRYLHYGLPAQRFVSVMSSPFWSFPPNLVYATWFLLNGFGLSWMAISRDFAVRRRFWASFVLCFALLGTGMALAFLSAGPCFYDYVVSGANPYEDQMQALHQANQHFGLNSIWLQDEFRAYLDGGNPIGGASAMPSMHVSTCVLFSLVVWQRHRWLGIALAFYAFLTQIACVWLGWHYAIDGYVAALGTWIIWRIVGCFTESKHGKADPSPQPPSTIFLMTLRM
jgi:hypothetical protein